MQKINLLLAFLCITCSAIAQETEKEKPAFSPSYAVKWNPTGLVLGKVSLFGEYNFKRKKSFTLGVGIPYDKTLSIDLDDKKTELKMKTSSVMAGYRMYMGKKDMGGFYFEPYLKYVKNDAAMIIDGTLDGKQTDFLTTSKYSGIGVGAQLGVQFLIAKKVTLDLFILGPEANSVKHTVIMRDITSTGPWDAQDAADAQKEIEDTIGDLPIIGKKINVVVDPNARTVTSDYKGFLPGIRSGISIGFRF